MAYRKVDNETGFVEYYRTPEETTSIELREENEDLKKRLELLEKKLLEDFDEK